MKRIIHALFLILAAIAGMIAKMPVQTLAASPEKRTALSFEELMAENYREDAPIDNRYFMPVGEEIPVLHPFEGTLSVPWIEMKNTAHQTVHESNEGLRWFPPFSTQFFTHDDFLVPVERSILCPDEPHYWCIILSPGKVWSEPGDHGMSRVSFPFVLVNAWSNNTHNGLATFLYDDTQVSFLRFQIIQETSADKPYQCDMWGQAPITYEPGSVQNRGNLTAEFTKELAQQVPIHPWAELEEQHDPQVLNMFTDPYAPEAISAAGVVIDGSVYLKPPVTRYGEYPYPRYMRHGVYSVTKSMGAAIAMLRLAQKYGDDVFELKIADYVEISAKYNGWDEVTFADALNMATGIGDSPPERNNANFSGDEFKPQFRDFIMARSMQEKLNLCFSYPTYPWGPGEIARYNSINTFVLSAAMNGLLKTRESPDTHLWDLVQEEIFNPIGILHLPTMHTVEPNGSRGIPLMFMGLYPTVDDVAKISMLFQNGGQHNGEQILNRGKTEEALYRQGLSGLPTEERYQHSDRAYHLSFRGFPYRTEDGRFFQIPWMSGAGGNTVVLAPNGISGFVLNDAGVYVPEAMTQVLETIRPFPGEGIEVDQLVLLPEAIRLLPTTRKVFRFIDRVLLVWCLLTVSTLVFFLYHQTRGMPMTLRMRGIWLLIIVCLGPLGLMMYLFVHRRSNS